MRTIKDVFDEMKKLVSNGGVYRFSPVDDGDIIEGKPVSSGAELFVELTKDLPYAKKGDCVSIDVDDFQFMEVEKIG